MTSACAREDSNFHTRGRCRLKTVRLPISPRAQNFFSRGGRIRTYDLHIPNVARYRATLHPELFLLAESGGFEPPVQFNPYDSLANCWFQPLTQLSIVPWLLRREMPFAKGVANIKDNSLQSQSLGFNKIMPLGADFSHRH